jgi:hypothetical protein
MIRRRKPYSQMNAEELRAATKEFDREFVRETFGPPTARAKTSLADAREKRRNTNRNGSAKVSISVERKLLKQADAFAKQHRMSRSQVVAAGLKRVLGAA